MESWLDIVIDGKGPDKNIRCRHCKRLNRISVKKALTKCEAYRCSACDGLLFVSPGEYLDGLPPVMIQHPLDAATLRNFKAIPGVSILVKQFFRHFREPTYRHYLRASAVQCGEDQCPNLYKSADFCLRRLDIRKKCTLFLSMHAMPNMYISSANEALLVVTSSMACNNDAEQLKFAFGHEMGHLKCEHTVYRLMASILLGSSVSLVPEFARYLSIPLRSALMKWIRCSELSADRAGLLCVKSPTIALESIMRMAGGYDHGSVVKLQLDLDAFIRQARDLKESDRESLFDSFMAVVLTWNDTHPLATLRALELIDWMIHGDYLNILAGDYGF